jgi:hypothetical protein
VESPTQVASTCLPQSRYPPACPAFLTADTLAARWLQPHMMDSGPAASWTISPCCTDIEDKNESEEKLKEN